MVFGPRVVMVRLGFWAWDLSFSVGLRALYEGKSNSLASQVVKTTSSAHVVYKALSLPLSPYLSLSLSSSPGHEGSVKPPGLSAPPPKFHGVFILILILILILTHTHTLSLSL